MNTAKKSNFIMTSMAAKSAKNETFYFSRNKKDCRVSLAITKMHSR